MIPLTHLPIAQNRQLASHHPAGGLICKSSAHDTLYPRVGALPSLQGLARHGSSGPARNFSGPALFNCHPNVRRSAVSMTTVATPEVTTTSEDQAMEPTTLALLGPERASAVQLALEISQLGSEQEYYVWVDGGYFTLWEFVFVAICCFCCLCQPSFSAAGILQSCVCGR